MNKLLERRERLMNRIKEAAKSPKGIITSRTSQNVTAGGGVGIIAAELVMDMLRRFAGDAGWMWDTAYDDEAMIVLAIILTPLLARALAFFRNPEKADE